MFTVEPIDDEWCVVNVTQTDLGGYNYNSYSPRPTNNQRRDCFGYDDYLTLNNRVNGISFLYRYSQSPRTPVSRSFGMRPFTSRSRNEFNDKECEHLNIKGQAYLFAESSQFTISKLENSGFSAWPIIRGTNPSYSTSLCYVWCGRHSGSGFARTEDGEDNWVWERFNSDLLIFRNKRTYKGHSWTIQIIISVEPEFVDAKLRRLHFSLTQSISASGYFGRRNATTRKGQPVTGYFNINAIACRCFPGPQFTDLVRQDVLSWRCRSLLQRARTDIGYAGIGSEDTWGDISLRCAQSVRSITDNEVANVMDLIDLATFDPSDLFESAGHGGASLISSAYLSEHYGFENNARDIGSILNADFRKATRYVRNALISRAGGREVNTGKLGSWQSSYYLKMYYRPPTDLCQFLAYFAWANGFSPSLETVWDLIPFSFVVDWAINVGDNFNRLDSAYFLAKLQILSVVKTTKSVLPIPAALIDSRWSGILTVAHYQRQILETLPPYPLGLVTTAPSPDHFWEGAALLVQQLRH